MLPVSRPRFLDIARALALVSPLAAACGGSATPLANSGGPAPTASSSATTAPTTDGADPTVGSGPCRCSWDTNQAAAPRVCKKGEPSYEGAPCVPGQHYPTDEGYYPGVGPYPPPDLV